MPLPLPSHAALAVLAAVLLLLAAAASHAPLDDPGAGSRASADHGYGYAGAMACAAAEEGCVGGEETSGRRRELGGGNYIGYDALRRNAVPCSYRGASYYNCRPGGQANPYSRGCSAITRCRG